MSTQPSISEPGLHVAPSPAVLQVKDSPDVDLKAFIESRCQSLLTEFQPAWWLFNGDLQTAFCVTGDFSEVDKVVYERYLLRVPDGGTLGLDFAMPMDPDTQNDTTPIVVVMHGLTGGSYESYVRSILSFACSAKQDGGLGYRGVVVNFRGCAGVELTSPQFYSAGYTDDLRTALLYLSTRFPHAKLLGVGFSLGANVMTRYLGEEGANSKLVSACVLGCPWNLVKNSYSLEGNWFSRNVYSKAMAKNLCELVKRNLPSLSQLGPSILTPHLTTLASKQYSRLIDVDEDLTRLVGGSSPPFPFSSAQAYYEWASSHRHLDDIQVPFLAINALDDPIVRCLPIPLSEKASHVALYATRHGGHLGWFQRDRKAGHLAVDRWVRAPVCEWLKATGDELIVETGEKVEVEKVDGFTRLVGNPKIGYMEVGKSEVIASTAADGVLAGL